MPIGQMWPLPIFVSNLVLECSRAHQSLSDDGLCREGRAEWLQPTFCSSLQNFIFFVFF